MYYTFTIRDILFVSTQPVKRNGKGGRCVETKSMQIKKLKSELADVSKEINERITKEEKMPTAGKQGYIEMKKIIANKQTESEIGFRKSLISSGEEVWDFAWKSVWEAYNVFKCHATEETKNNYKKLEPALRSKQSHLKAALKVSEMSCDQV